MTPKPLPETQVISDLVRRYIARRTLKQERADLAGEIAAWMEGMILPGSDRIRLLRHFIIFERRPDHCATWLVQAKSLEDACRKWGLDQCAIPGKGDTLVIDFGDHGEVAYEHPLACIEAIYKVQHSKMRGWNGWEVRELRDEAYKAELAEVFCSEYIYSIQ